MKKILITLLALFMLVGCSKKITWEDVQDRYDDVKNEVDSITSTMESIVSDDYKALLSELQAYIEQAKYDISDDNQDLLTRIYKVAYYIKNFSSRVNSAYANKLSTLANDAIDLCKAAFEENEENFESLKGSILAKIEELMNGSKQDWNSVEVVKSISWEEVESEFEQISQFAIQNLTDPLDITEYELDDLKHQIIDNFDEIADGVITSSNNETAKEIYAAACRLQAYAKRINYNDAQKVRDFVWATKAYIEQSYGKVLDEDDQLDRDYSEYVNEAKKWTQSTWNEITALMKVEAMQALQEEE